MISISGGLIVTRASSETKLGQDFRKQVFSSSQPLLRLGIALFFAQSAFHIYNASLPLYFAGLGFDPTLIGLLIGALFTWPLSNLPGWMGRVGPTIVTLLFAWLGVYVAVLRRRDRAG